MSRQAEDGGLRAAAPSSDRRRFLFDAAFLREGYAAPSKSSGTQDGRKAPNLGAEGRQQHTGTNTAKASNTTNTSTVAVPDTRLQRDATLHTTQTRLTDKADPPASSSQNNTYNSNTGKTPRVNHPVAVLDADAHASYALWEEESLMWRLTVRADVFAQHAALRRAFLTWLRRRPLRRQITAMHRTADLFRETALKRKGAQAWKATLALKRTVSDAMVLAEAFARNMLLINTLHSWRASRSRKVQEDAAVATASGTLARRFRRKQAIRRWRETLARKTKLASLLARGEMLRVHHLRKRYLLHWHQRGLHALSLQKQLNKHLLARQRRSASLIFKTWRLGWRRKRWSQALAQLADDAHRSTLASSALSAWRKHTKRSLALQATGHRCVAQVREVHLLRRVLSLMRVALRKRRYLKRLQATADAAWNKKLIRLALGHWQALHERREAALVQPMMLKALRHHRHRLTEAAWIVWLQSRRRKQSLCTLMRIADHHRRAVVHPAVFYHWQRQAHLSAKTRDLQQRAVYFLAQHVQRGAFQHWWVLLRGHVREREMTPTAHSYREAVLLIRTIRLWKTRLQELAVSHAREEVAIAFRTAHTLAASFARWHKLLQLRVTARHNGMIAAAHHRRQLAQRAWGTWSQLHRKFQGLERLHAIVQARHRTTLQVAVFIRWQDAFQWKGGLAAAEASARARAQAHLQARYFTEWLDRLRAKKARQRRESHIRTSAFFVVWRRVHKMLLATKAAREHALKSRLQHRNTTMQQMYFRVWRQRMAAKTVEEEKLDAICRKRDHDTLLGVLLFWRSGTRHRIASRERRRRALIFHEQTLLLRFLRVMHRRWQQRAERKRMSNTALLMWARSLQKQALVKMRAVHAAKIREKAVRQRLWEWRRRQLALFGIRQIYQVSDQMMMRNQGNVIARGGLDRDREYSLARTALFRWKRYVRRRQQDRQAKQKDSNRKLHERHYQAWHSQPPSQLMGEAAMAKQQNLPAPRRLGMVNGHDDCEKQQQQGKGTPTGEALHAQRPAFYTSLAQMQASVTASRLPSLTHPCHEESRPLLTAPVEALTRTGILHPPKKVASATFRSYPEPQQPQQRGHATVKTSATQKSFASSSSLPDSLSVILPALLSGSRRQRKPPRRPSSLLFFEQQQPMSLEVEQAHAPQPHRGGPLSPTSAPTQSQTTNHARRGSQQTERPVVAAGAISPKKRMQFASVVQHLREDIAALQAMEIGSQCGEGSLAHEREPALLDKKMGQLRQAEALLRRILEADG